jgi:hypothetical protein
VRMRRRRDIEAVSAAVAAASELSVHLLTGALAAPLYDGTPVSFRRLQTRASIGETGATASSPEPLPCAPNRCRAMGQNDLSEPGRLGPK